MYDGLLAAGVAEAPLAALMPATLADTAARPGDERLTLLMTRRSTVDWVLLRAVLAAPGVSLRCGVRVLGLRAAPGGPPRVTGVRTDQGDHEADLVVDATGRRSPLDRWLGEIGARPTATRWAECGVAYFTRHYRLRPGAALPGSPTTRLVVGLDEFTVGIWGADNGAMQLAVVPLATDRRLPAAQAPGGLHRGAAHRPDLRRLARRLRPDQSRLRDGRGTQHRAPPRRRRRPGGHGAARPRRLGLHHQPDPGRPA